jgi:DnaK suppressor protein
MHTSELTFLQETLKERKLQILKNIDGIYAELNQLDTCEIKDEGDYAAISNSSIVENTIGEQQKEELRVIEVALSKITFGRYGTCEMCGEKINFDRLKVKPHATYCIDCREYVEKNA